MGRDDSCSLPTIPEVRKAITALKNRISPGDDSISAELFTIGGKSLAASIHLLNLAGGGNPKWYRVILPFFKKGDKSVCSNYRGISLLDIGLKLHESVILNRFKKREKQLGGSRKEGLEQV